MNNFNNTEQLKDRLEKYKIEDDRNKYIFKANWKYMLSSSIFFYSDCVYCSIFTI